MINLGKHLFGVALVQLEEAAVELLPQDGTIIME